MRTILVTGGEGFIGFHVAKRLSKKNNVIVYDIASGKDIRDLTQLLRVFRQYKPDVVCHIAGLASNISSFSNPQDDAQTNFIGTINVVSACIATGTPRLVYASSMMANNESSYYGISKFAAERFVHATAMRPDLKKRFSVTSLRMFNVYGPGQSPTNPYQGVLAIFVGNVLRGEPIKIFGTGTQSRDFIYIDDVSRFWEEVIDKPKTFGKVLELGSGKAVSINQLARAVILACRKNPKTYPIEYHKARPGDMRVSKAKRKMSTISLADGLQRTVAWVKSSRIL